MNEHCYKTLDAYKVAKELVKCIYQLLKEFPREEQYALCDQLRRAAISVPSNIAEGISRYSNKEKSHFMEIAFGSLMEVEPQIDIAFDLGYINKDELDRVMELVARESKMISGLRAKYNS